MQGCNRTLTNKTSKSRKKLMHSSERLFSRSRSAFCKEYGLRATMSLPSIFKYKIYTKIFRLDDIFVAQLLLLKMLCQVVRVPILKTTLSDLVQFFQLRFSRVTRQLQFGKSSAVLHDCGENIITTWAILFLIDNYSTGRIVMTSRVVA